MLLPFFTMTAMQAANLNQATLGREHVLEPRRVEAGAYTGRYVISTRAASDPAYAIEFAPLFAVLPTIALDTEEAWLQLEES